MASMCLLMLSGMSGYHYAARHEIRRNIFYVRDKSDFDRIAANGDLEGGDILVLWPLNLDGTYEMSSKPKLNDQHGDLNAEPTYIVGQKLFNRVLRTHNLTSDDMEARAEARQLLSGFPKEGNRSPGSSLETGDLTSLTMSQVSFRTGAWSVSGFDIKGYTTKGSLIVVDSEAPVSARLSLVSNRISNCDRAFKTCSWNALGTNGEKRNGGVLIRIASSAGTSLENNTFENLRGFILISVGEKASKVSIVHNTFSHLRPWAGNAAEAIHLGVVPPVKASEDEPVFDWLDTVVADNLFNDASAENELIGVKGAGTRIVGNWIVNSKSGISLRDGSDTLVEGNTIVRSYGIRIMGDRQTVRSNKIVLPIDNYGIWFENGAGQAGYACQQSQPFGLLQFQTWVGPLRWLYRPAREPSVTGNSIEVTPGGESMAISRRNFEKPCGWRRCDGQPGSSIPCDRQLPDSEFQDIECHGENKIAVHIDRRTQSGNQDNALALKSCNDQQ